MQEIALEDFLKVDMQIGTILAVELNKKAKVPAYIPNILGFENSWL